MKRSVFKLVINHSNDWRSFSETIVERVIKDALRSIGDVVDVECKVVSESVDDVVIPAEKDQIRISSLNKKRYVCLSVDENKVWVKAKLYENETYQNEDYRTLDKNVFESWEVVE
jgi:hypothetical protein